jgi:Flp pilus assembly protein TadD
LRQAGLRYRRQGEFPKAVAALEEAVRLDRANVSGRVLWGWTLHLAEQSAEAEGVLRETAREFPEDVPARNALGIVYLVRGNYDGAIETHERARTLKADNEIAYYNLALAYERRGDYDLAAQRGRKATELEPGNPHPWVALALVYWRRGETDEAKNLYNQAVRLDGRYRSADFLSHLRQAGFSAEQIAIVEGIRAAH